MYTIDNRITGDFKAINTVLDAVIGGKMFISKYKLDIGKTIKIRQYKIWKLDSK